MPTLNRYTAPQSTHWPGCWRYAGHHLCTVALVEELAAVCKHALEFVQAWDKYASWPGFPSSDLAQELQAVLAKVSGEEAESGSD